MISDLPLISGGIPAHGTTAVLSQPQWVVGAALPIWPRYLHRRQLKIVLKHSWKTLSTQNGSIVFGHSIHYAPTSHVSFGIALVWTPECSGQAKKRFGFCFWICHQRNSNAGWLMWCSFPLQYWWQHFSTQVTSGKGFIGTFFAWQEGSGVPTSIALVKG